MQAQHGDDPGDGRPAAGPPAEGRPGDPVPLGARPDLVAWATPQLRLTQIGLGSAVLAVAACLAALASFPDLAASPVGSGWALATTAAALVLLVVCAVQHVAWRRALAAWTGTVESEPGPLRRISWAAHVVSYAALLLGLWAGIAGSVAAGTTSRVAGVLAFALLFLLGAQALAGVNYLRTSGPAGTVPGHLRRLAARVQQLR